jgi:hypothetical protein
MTFIGSKWTVLPRKAMPVSWHKRRRKRSWKRSDAKKTSVARKRRNIGSRRRSDRTTSARLIVKNEVARVTEQNGVRVMMTAGVVIQKRRIENSEKMKMTARGRESIATMMIEAEEARKTVSEVVEKIGGSRMATSFPANDAPKARFHLQKKS